MSKTDFSNEILMAFADGELAAEQARTVGEIAARDPSIADRIALFRASRTVLSRAYSQVLEAPIPLEIYETALGLGPDGPVREQEAALQRARSDAAFLAFLGRLGAWKTVAALAFAALIGLLAGQRMADRAPGAGGGLAAELAAMPPPLARELERRPSGEPASIALAGGAADFLAVASYSSRGGLCREFEAAPSSGNALRGVACRYGGRWSLNALADASGNAPAAGDYRPASGGDDLAAWLGLGPALSPQDESRLLSGGARAGERAP